MPKFDRETRRVTGSHGANMAVLVAQALSPFASEEQRKLHGAPDDTLTATQKHQFVDLFVAYFLKTEGVFSEEEIAAMDRTLRIALRNYQGKISNVLEAQLDANVRRLNYEAARQDLDDLRLFPWNYTDEQITQLCDRCSTYMDEFTNHTRDEIWNRINAIRNPKTEEQRQEDSPPDARTRTAARLPPSIDVGPS